MSGEWPLILLTFFAQASVGILWALMTARAAGGKAGRDKGNWSKWLLWGFPLAVAAALASLFHLENPLYAPYSILNLRSSWLSREIFFLVLFAGCWLAAIVLDRLKKDKASRIIGWLGAAFGLFLVFSMSMVYMHPIQPAWNTFLTMLMFFTTAVSIGFSVVAVLTRKDMPAAGAHRTYAVISLIGGLIGLAASGGKYLLLSNSQVEERVASAALMTGDYLAVFVSALVLFLVGVIALALYLYRAKKGAIKSWCLYLGAAALPVAFLLDRAIFFAAHVKIGF